MMSRDCADSRVGAAKRNQKPFLRYRRNGFLSQKNAEQKPERIVVSGGESGGGGTNNRGCRETVEHGGVSR